tara:strand:- start:11831 stop:12040 length:210 start_codon:yes stop_codon:yes gene_type:complete
MTSQHEEKNKRLEILKQEEKIISELNDTSELSERLNKIKESHNRKYSINDEVQEEPVRKIAIPENDNSI